MKSSCSYCGRIHEKSFDCGKKPTRIKARGDAERFRSSALWQKKTVEIKERDHYLCQLCLRGYEGTTRKINSKNLSVHHVIRIKDDYEKRLDNENLITLCDVHHELAEANLISVAKILSIVSELEYPPT